MLPSLGSRVLNFFRFATLEITPIPGTCTAMPLVMAVQRISDTASRKYCTSVTVYPVLVATSK